MEHLQSFNHPQRRNCKIDVGFEWGPLLNAFRVVTSSSTQKRHLKMAWHYTSRSRPSQVITSPKPRNRCSERMLGIPMLKTSGEIDEPNLNLTAGPLVVISCNQDLGSALIANKTTTSTLKNNKQLTRNGRRESRLENHYCLLHLHIEPLQVGVGVVCGFKSPRSCVICLCVCVCVVDGCPSFCRCCFDQHRSFNGIEMMVGMVFPPPCLVLNFDSFLWWLWRLLIHLRLGCFNSFWCSPPSLGKIPILTTISLVEMMQFHQHTHLVGENIITFSNPTQAHEAVHFQQKPRRLMMCWRCLPGYLFNWSELVYLP